MAISAESLFHFTSLKNLRSILECKYFQVNYSEEQFTFRGNRASHFVPMICFCDIPLTQTEDHIEEYDGFAIGLSKEWGIGHGFNPVFYINELVLTVTLENLSIGLQPNDFSKGAFEHTFAYLKPYRGLNLKNPAKKEKVFYDEKEWRFVPYVTQFQDKVVNQIYWGKKPSMKVSNYINGHRFFKKEFNVSDIRYIISKTEKEKSELLMFLKNSEYLDSLQNQTFKILTVNEIYGNF
jgi:hypothetical protein